MARIIWSRAALVCVVGIRDYIRQNDPPAANRTAARLLAAGESLATFPNRGVPQSDGSRTLSSVSPYIITYDVFGETVTILDVRHSAQAPRTR